MKYAPLFLLIFSYTFGMESPQLTQIPFEGEPIQLTSFAESMVLGKLKIGNSGSSESKKEIEFVFSDFRNPETTYKATRAQAWNATRYIAAVNIYKIMLFDENIIFVHPDPQKAEKYTKDAAEQKAKYTAQLTALNVSQAILKENCTKDDWEMPLQRANIHETDFEETKALKVAQLITTLQRLKDVPAFLQHVAFRQFYRFWSGQDLVYQTQKDQLRDFAQVKKNREIFFKALETNDATTLVSYSNQFESLLKKKTLPVGQAIEKMIHILVTTPKPWRERSPQNSDEEVW
jgi:hypothetical protein